ncbi:large ribosomal subunit protein eL6-like [Dysidea avara]|uniref:large ribosomal subunit protein eL6-like n=1 Tax=Dysidea avara TaxID=196820 RepID=UPI003319708F
MPTHVVQFDSGTTQFNSSCSRGPSQVRTMGNPHQPRNYLLARGVSRYGRTAMYKKKAIYKKKLVKVPPPTKKVQHIKVKEVGGDKNGKTRVVQVHKSPRYYPTEDDPRRLKMTKRSRAPKLRSSITPGTVLILVAGRHMGKRVVFLKQLETGLLLVTGPYLLNGVPLRRVSQTYVIATQTKVDLAGFVVPEKFDDAYFKRTEAKKAEGESVFKESEQGYSASDERKQDQKDIDQSVLGAVAKIPELKGYLRGRFTLQKGQYPHKMVF